MLRDIDCLYFEKVLQNDLIPSLVVKTTQILISKERNNGIAFITTNLIQI